MEKKQEELGGIVLADPAVHSIAMFIGGGGSALNNGRMYVTLKPREERNASAQQVIERLRPKLEQVEGARQFLQASQDVRLGGRATRTQFEYTLQDADLDELNAWAPRVLKKLQTLPQLRDVATDQQTNGTTLTLTIDRDAASRYGVTPQLIDDTLYDAFGQRQVAQYFTQLNTYRVILEILPDLQGKVDTLDKIYVKSPLTGEQVPLSVFAKWTTVPVRPLSISHQGQFPAITISFNLAQGVALGQATDAIQNAMRELGTARHPQRQLPGHRAGVSAVARHRSAAHSGRAHRRIFDPWHSLRKLHPSDHDPVDAAVGGYRRARDADAVRLRLQPDRTDWDHPADRHRQEERHHDG